MWAQTAMSNMRFSAEDLQIINEVLEEIRAIDQEAAKEEFEEMEARHGVSPSVDPRESDKVNDETDSDKEFARKKRRRPGSQKLPKAKTYCRHREERSPEGLSESEVESLGVPIRNTRIDDLHETQRQLDYAFRRMLQHKYEHKVRMTALERTLCAILDRIIEEGQVL
ncbi:hypothetical protein B0H17DRAFT_1131673 [Mycena rosella]|uniref:Uncharacterized protein n=1 Tax=Mycena rosella TaxID=1033263 RepID=A0AAD7DNC1_MYCRO|nr:hypothetical protein B0H17DRAFT_1131673 [Mycena rosella]